MMDNMNMMNTTVKELSAEELKNVSAGADSNPTPNGSPLLLLIWMLGK